jgi:hypothetical protein
MSGLPVLERLGILELLHTEGYMEKYGSKQDVLRWSDKGAFKPVFVRVLSRRAASNLKLSPADLDELAENLGDWLELNVEKGRDISFKFWRKSNPRGIRVLVQQARIAKRGFTKELQGWSDVGECHITFSAPISK